MSDASPQIVDSRPWRKRRPVLSRVVLYGLGLAAAGVIAFLLATRKKQDDEDQLEILRQRLLNLPATVLGVPGGENEVLKVLASDDFTDEDLPNDIKSLVERTRAMALRRKLIDPTKTMEVRAQVDAALQKAKALAPAEQQQALALEWAESRVESGTTEGVAALLSDPAVAWTWQPAKILRAYLEAAILAQDGDRPGATKHLDSQLAALAAPLSTSEDHFIGGKPWSPAEAALVATEKLARLHGGQGEARIWERIRALAPDHWRAHVRAAEAFATMGRQELALEAWNAGLAANEAEAKGSLEADPTIRELKKLLAETREALK